jgi:hypothetical protein
MRASTLPHLGRMMSAGPITCERVRALLYRPASVRLSQAEERGAQLPQTLARGVRVLAGGKCGAPKA